MVLTGTSIAAGKVKRTSASGGYTLSDNAAGHLHSMQSLGPKERALAPTASESLHYFMQAGEFLEAVAFSDTDFPGPRAIPQAVLNRVLTPSEANAHMQSWSLLGGFGSVESYAMTAWTNQRVIWVTQYDGRTTLHSAPRLPPAFGQAFRCEMPGAS